MMSTIDPTILTQRITQARLSSYLNDVGGDAGRALALYDWNVALAGALHETLGRFEVVQRNALDEQLVALVLGEAGRAHGSPERGFSISGERRTFESPV